MTEALVHRGPDDEGFFVDSHIALGMRRLAIVDIDGGRQPMITEDGRLALIFNGEIYNHHTLRRDLAAAGLHCHTHCDTEVVLRQLEGHGTNGIQALEGMFALAAWNTKSRELILARDWLGQKSLYWTRTKHGFAFASEIKALLRLPGVQREMDLTALSQYMSFRYLPGERTFFAGIQKLPPGHLMRVRADGCHLEEIWRPSYQPKHSVAETSLLDELDGLLSEVVAEHLMGDVPIGCFLSGGIDSSLVVHYASLASANPIRTFAVAGFDDGESELPWARQVAQSRSTLHTEAFVKPDLALLAPRMVSAMEEPVDPFAAGIYLVSGLARQQVTVCLGGDGGDELFAGYDRYQGQRLAEIYAAVPRAIRHGLIRPFLRASPDSFTYKSIAARLHWLDNMADLSGVDRYVESLSHLRFSHAAKQQLFAGRAKRSLDEDTDRLLHDYFLDGAAESFLDRMLYTDCRTRLSENQLPTIDRMSMAHGLEARSPFLDRRIAQFAMHVPTSLQIRHGNLKHLPRRLVARHYTRDLAYRPKRGFGFPISLWLKGPLRILLERLLEQSRLVQAGLFRYEVLAEMLREHSSGRVDHGYRLWMWFNLEIFWRFWLAQEPVDSIEEWIEAARQS